MQGMGTLTEMTTETAVEVVLTGVEGVVVLDEDEGTEAEDVVLDEVSGDPEELLLDFHRSFPLATFESMALMAITIGGF